MTLSLKEAWFITLSLLVSLFVFLYSLHRVSLQTHRAEGITDLNPCDMILNSFSSCNASRCDIEKIKSDSYITSDTTPLLLLLFFISHLPRKLHFHQLYDILTAPQKFTLYMKPCVKLYRKTLDIVIYFPILN